MSERVCIDCAGPVSRGTKYGRCRPCCNTARIGVPLKPGEVSYSSAGYVLLYGYREHPNAYKNGAITEHVLVMSTKIGRALLPTESVHHKNGDRSDNRPSNLELWSRYQPAGQRVEDKLKWAREILALYGTDSECDC